MSDVFGEVMNKGAEPTRADIARLLAVTGKPGAKRDEKSALVKRLFTEGGFRGTNSQGHAVWDALESYEQW